MPNLTPIQLRVLQQMAKNAQASPQPKPQLSPQDLVALKSKLTPTKTSPVQSSITPQSLMMLKAKMASNTPQVAPAKTQIPGGQISRYSAGGVVQRMADGGEAENEELTANQILDQLGAPKTQESSESDEEKSPNEVLQQLGYNTSDLDDSSKNKIEELKTLLDKGSKYQPSDTVSSSEDNYSDIPNLPIEPTNATDKTFTEDAESPITSRSTATDKSKDKEDDSDEEDEEESDQAKVSTPNAQLSVPKDYIGDLLKRTGYDPSALKTAQQAQQQIMMGNSLNMAGKEIAAAMSRGGYKPDYTSNQQVNALAALPVQNQIQQQKILADAVQTGATMSDLEDKQKLQDPTSAVSKAYRATAINLLPSIAKSPGFENMSAEGIKQILPMADIAVRSTANQEIAKERMQNQQMMMQMRNEQHTTDKQNQVYNQGIQLSEQMRGSPAVAQAEKDIYAGQKAQDLLKLAPGGDFNKMSQQQINLYATEIAKIAQGGQSSIAELQALTPKSISSQFSNSVSRFINGPTAANLGAFVKQYDEYGKALQKTAQNEITDRYGRLWNPKKSELTPEQWQSVQDNYLNRFKQQSSSTSSAPDHAGAAQWVQQNINNPDPEIRAKAMQISQSLLQNQRGGM